MVLVVLFQVPQEVLVQQVPQALAVPQAQVVVIQVLQV